MYRHASHSGSLGALRRTTRIILAGAALAFPAPATSAPASRAPTFQARAISGETLALDTLRTRGPVLLDFWATWCKPCIAAIPELQALYEKYRERGFTIVGISADGPRNYAKVRPFVKRHGITYPIVLDQDGALQEKYQVLAIPTAVLVSPSGEVAKFHQGYRPGDTAELERLIATMLASVPAQDMMPDSAAADSAGSR